MAYITAILQTTARKTDQPLDQMYIWTDITTMMSGEEVESYAEDGMYIHGMYMDVDLTGIFECPIYVTTKRGATFTCVATLKSADRINKWVLAGVAIMMSDDIAG